MESMKVSANKDEVIEENDSVNGSESGDDLSTGESSEAGSADTETEIAPSK